MSELHHGSCLCGAVTYRVTAPLKAVSHCHCKKCRKSHGAAFATYASARVSAVVVTSPSGALKGFESSPGVSRQFCSSCGSSLFWSDANGEFREWISIAVGTLDTPFLPPTQKHICVDDKLGWITLD